MNVTSKGRYALRMVIDLAEHADDGFISLKDIAARQGLSKKYLEQIFSSLKRSKLVISSAGKLGGYKLSRPAENISILDVITVMDGGLIPIHCVNNKDCTVCSQCSINGLWYEMKNHMEEYLKRISIASLNDKKYPVLGCPD